MTLNTYLTFDSNCREAFEFYRSVFGGEFAEIHTFGEGPPEMGVPEDERDLIMHVSLPIGSSVLMGSDSSSTQGPPPVIGSNFSISVIPDSKEEPDRLYAGLSEGGTTVMPMADAFWGSYFGMCVDPFGVRWQINFEYPVSGASG